MFGNDSFHVTKEVWWIDFHKFPFKSFYILRTSFLNFSVNSAPFSAFQANGRMQHMFT